MPYYSVNYRIEVEAENAIAAAHEAHRQRLKSPASGDVAGYEVDNCHGSVVMIELTEGIISNETPLLQAA